MICLFGSLGMYCVGEAAVRYGIELSGAAGLITTPARATTLSTRSLKSPALSRVRSSGGQAKIDTKAMS
jgi:hypothetical protein